MEPCPIEIDRVNFNDKSLIVRTLRRNESICVIVRGNYRFHACVREVDICYRYNCETVDRFEITYDLLKIPRGLDEVTVIFCICRCPFKVCVCFQKNIKDSMNAEEDCGICFEPMSICVELSQCHHKFHKECILRAFAETSRRCPYCRKSYFKVASIFKETDCRKHVANLKEARIFEKTHCGKHVAIEKIEDIFEPDLFYQDCLESTLEIDHSKDEPVIFVKTLRCNEAIRIVVRGECRFHACIKELNTCYYYECGGVEHLEITHSMLKTPADKITVIFSTGFSCHFYSIKRLETLDPPSRYTTDKHCGICYEPLGSPLDMFRQNHLELDCCHTVHNSCIINALLYEKINYCVQCGEPFTHGELTRKLEYQRRIYSYKECKHVMIKKMEKGKKSKEEGLEDRWKEKKLFAFIIAYSIAWFIL